MSWCGTPCAPCATGIQQLYLVSQVLGFGTTAEVTGTYTFGVQPAPAGSDDPSTLFPFSVALAMPNAASLAVYANQTYNDEGDAPAATSATASMVVALNGTALYTAGPALAAFDGTAFSLALPGFLPDADNRTGYAGGPVFYWGSANTVPPLKASDVVQVTVTAAATFPPIDSSRPYLGLLVGVLPDFLPAINVNSPGGSSTP